MTPREEKIERIIRHCQNIAVLCDVMDIELSHDLSDYQFNDPRLGNHNRRIKESINQIKLSLASKVKSLSYEDTKYNHGTQLWRVFRFFSTMATPQIVEIMDGYEEIERKAREEAKLNQHADNIRI